MQTLYINISKVNIKKLHTRQTANAIHETIKLVSTHDDFGTPLNQKYHTSGNQDEKLKLLLFQQIPQK